VKIHLPVRYGIFVIIREYSWLNAIFGLEIIEDIKAKKLKRYGEVLDPQLNIIIDLLSKMGPLLRGTPK